MSEIKSNHSVEETLHIQSLKLGQQLKRIIEQDARIVGLEAERDELSAQLVAVKEGGGTGQSPCAKFCESVALKKDFERLKAERDALAAQVEYFKKAIKAIENDLIECSYDDESGYFVGIDSISDACDIANYVTPQQHLREDRANAGRAGFVAGMYSQLHQRHCTQQEQNAAADQYADKVRQGGSE